MTRKEKFEDLVFETLDKQVEEMNEELSNGGSFYELADCPLHFKENGISHQILSHDGDHEGWARLSKCELEELKDSLD